MKKKMCTCKLLKALMYTDNGVIDNELNESTWKIYVSQITTNTQNILEIASAIRHNTV